MAKKIIPFPPKLGEKTPPQQALEKLLRDNKIDQSTYRGVDWLLDFATLLDRLLADACSSSDFPHLYRRGDSMRKRNCPLEWCISVDGGEQFDWRSRFGCISWPPTEGCIHHPNKARCWAIYDAEVAKGQ